MSNKDQSYAADIEVNDVRLRMHNVTECAIEGLHCLGSTCSDTPEVESFAMDLTFYAKPDAWDRLRVLRNQLYFESKEDLKGFFDSFLEAYSKLDLDKGSK